LRFTKRHTFFLGLAAGAALAVPSGWFSSWGGEGSPERGNEGLNQGSAPDGSKRVGGAENAALPHEVTAPLPPDYDEASRWVDGILKPNQFVAERLTDAGVTLAEADLAIRSLSGVFDFRNARPGHRYRAQIGTDGRLLAFEYTAGVGEVYSVQRETDDAFSGKRLDIQLDREIVEVDGTIVRSLYEAFLDSGESPSLAMQLADAFRFDVDFFHDTRKGDRFRMFVEKFLHEGELVRYGQVYAAEYQGVEGGPIGTRRLYWYENEKTKTRGFFDESGTAARRAFLRSPLEYTRVSSGFGYRYHPILGKKHFHGGVDYAAPKGTPVHSIADGTVVFASQKGANGKMVKIRHSGGYESFYLHLSKFYVRPGDRVQQSTVVGAVGSTGRSTGPHLDFRIQRYGKYLNPHKQVAPRTASVPASEKTYFREAIASWSHRMDVDTGIARGQVDATANDRTPPL
jgi:murein DD-endopeptidase MepM/ murein hydrolase activator NlpD